MKTIQVRDIIQNKISLEEARGMAILHQGEVFKYFDEGLTRYVFTNNDRTKVIKLLKGNSKDYNVEEANIYNKASDEDKANMAHTTLSNGFIEQEFVMPIKFAGKKLTMEQIIFAQQCRNEVGWNKEGKLVCFDLDEYLRY